jgi:hypothetical protein
MESDKQNYLISLTQNAEILSQLNTTIELEDYCLLLLKKLKQINLSTTNALVLNYLINNILGKILCTIKEEKLPESISQLVDFLLEKDLVTNVYKMIFQRIYYKGLEIKFEEKNLEKIDEKEIEKNFNMNLDILLNLDSRAESYVNKNFGYSLLDLNGDIIWYDKNSEKFFEFNQKQVDNKNFFKLMIPFSITQIFKKFCFGQLGSGELFKDNDDIGKTVAFTYVIYSKENLSKYIKHLKKKGINDYNKIEQITKKDKNLKTLFYKYLKALSSKATLIILKFTKKEFSEILKNKKMNIKITNSMNKIIDDIKNYHYKDENKSKNNFFININNNDEVIYKLAILLETRISKHVPNYDFEKMKTDPQIVKFEEIVKEKIVKKN